MTSEEEYATCVTNQLDDFTRYDQYVDVVSCWEEFLRHYRPYFPDMYFDRYPTMPPIEGGDPLTPDFSVYFNDEYGIIFEVSRTFPIEEDLFDRELNQIRNYDQSLQFKSGDNTRSVPRTQDIVLLISTTDSQTIEHRIQSMLESGELDLESNLILMEYTYLDQDRTSQYQFKRLSRIENNFRDDVLPDDWQLSSKLSMDGGHFENIYSPVNKFYEYKATGVLCNDEPPGVYLVCYMWQHVFPEYLSQSDLERPQSITEIDIDLETLRNKLESDYIPDCPVKGDWVRNSLEFLIIAGVASKASGSGYKIRYRNLRDKRSQFEETVTERTRITDLAHLFSEWYCENLIAKETGEIEKMLSTGESDEVSETDEDDVSQSGLSDFL